MGDETDRNKAVVRRFVEEVQNEKNWESYDELNASDFVNLSAPPGVPADREGGKMFLGAFLNAFPDCEFTIDDMIAEGDRVLLRNRISGTNSKGVPWIGASPNGRPYEFESWSVYRVRDGKVVEHVGLNDVWMFAIQPGADQPPAPPPAPPQ